MLNPENDSETKLRTAVMVSDAVSAESYSIKQPISNVYFFRLRDCFKQK